MQYPGEYSGEYLGFFNPVPATGLFPCPLKISENLWFSEGIERDQWHEMD